MENVNIWGKILFFLQYADQNDHWVASMGRIGFSV
jgi:hypothetical protein